jgi:hypothetical protein
LSLNAGATSQNDSQQCDTDKSENPLPIHLSILPQHFFYIASIDSIMIKESIAMEFHPATSPASITSVFHPFPSKSMLQNLITDIQIIDVTYMRMTEGI